MNVSFHEGKRAHKDALCLRLISVLVAGRNPAFISPPEVNSRPVHAFFWEDVIVIGTEVLENADSDGAAREHHVSRIPFFEHGNKKKTCITSNTPHDVSFVIANNKSSLCHRSGLRQEVESLTHHFAVDHIGIESAEFFGETVAQGWAAQRDVVCGLSRLLESRNLVGTLRQDDVADSAIQNDAVN
jgi:hypothetical protein